MLHYVQHAQCKVENGQFLIEHSRETRSCCVLAITQAILSPFSRQLNSSRTCVPVITQVVPHQGTLSRAEQGKPSVVGGLE